MAPLTAAYDGVRKFSFVLAATALGLACSASPTPGADTETSVSESSPQAPEGADANATQGGSSPNTSITDNGPPAEVPPATAKPKPASPNSTEVGSPNVAVANKTWAVQTAAATKSNKLAFAVAISGKSGNGAYTISVANNAGTVKQGSRTTKVIVAETIDFAPHTLYSLFGVDSQGVVLGWAYCYSNGTLGSLWLEDTGGDADFTPKAVTGSCKSIAASTTASVQLEAASFTIAPPAPLPVIRGSGLSLPAAGLGQAFFNGHTYDLLPFVTVDCSACGQTASDGWLEVHSLARGNSPSDVCTGILYLYNKPNGWVGYSYLHCLTADLPRANFQATFTMPKTGQTAKLAATDFPAMGVPPSYAAMAAARRRWYAAESAVE